MTIIFGWPSPSVPFFLPLPIPFSSLPPPFSFPPSPCFSPESLDPYHSSNQRKRSGAWRSVVLSSLAGPGRVRSPTGFAAFCAHFASTFSCCFWRYLYVKKNEKMLKGRDAVKCQQHSRLSVAYARFRNG